MALLEEIIGWAGGLRHWQQEALRRIFANPQLSPDDSDMILNLLRDEELDENATSKGTSFTSADIPGAGTGSTVKLVKLSNLDQINGFPSGRAFELAPEGMVVLFGHNGAGKSGYARVLKNACKARHRLAVLSNAFTPVPGIPSAEFAILVDNVPQTVSWKQGAPAHPHLSSVSVYDVACSHDYIDVEGVPSFQPYGLAQLTRLALLQRELQTKIQAERTALRLDAGQFDSLKTDTEVGRHIAKLGHKSDLEVLIRLGTVSEVEAERLKFLKKTLVDSDPVPKALALERLAERLDSAQQRAINVQR